MNRTDAEAQPMERDVALSVFNAAIGAWLVISTLLWRHSTAEVVNLLVVGVACVAVAVLSARVPPARWLYLPLSAWTIGSAYVVPLRDPFTAPSLVAMGIAMLAVPLTARWFGHGAPREIARATAGP